MDTAPLSEIKKELKVLSSQQLQEIILRLAKFKIGRASCRERV